MCLYISSDQEKNERDLNKWFGSRKKFAYVYKILTKRDHEDFYRSVYFQDYTWDFSKTKIFKVNRSSKPTKEELKDLNVNHGAIDEGLHVYASLKEAKFCLDPNEVIVKFKVLKKDIVAINNLYGQAVCTKLEFVRIVD